MRLAPTNWPTKRARRQAQLEALPQNHPSVKTVQAAVKMAVQFATQTGLLFNAAHAEYREAAQTAGQRAVSKQVLTSRVRILP